jgi:multisubunit Na+/H+ antiporter MnhF subunit
MMLLNGFMLLLVALPPLGCLGPILTSPYPLDNGSMYLSALATTLFCLPVSLPYFWGYRAAASPSARRRSWSLWANAIMLALLGVVAVLNLLFYAAPFMVVTMVILMLPSVLNIAVARGGPSATPAVETSAG